MYLVRFFAVTFLSLFMQLIITVSALKSKTYLLSCKSFSLFLHDQRAVYCGRQREEMRRQVVIMYMAAFAHDQRRRHDMCPIAWASPLLGQRG
jgi:hypothetical protein